MSEQFKRVNGKSKSACSPCTSSKHRRDASIHISLIQNIILIQYIVNSWRKFWVFFYECTKKSSSGDIKSKRVAQPSVSTKIPNRAKETSEPNSWKNAVRTRARRETGKNLRPAPLLRIVWRFGKTVLCSRSLPWGLFLSVTWNGVAMETNAWAALTAD